MTPYLKCTYGEGMFSNEKLITFRATRRPVTPFGAGEEGAYTFSWFLQVPGLVYLDGRNALMPIEPNILNTREAAFLVCADQEVRWCFVPLEDIVERDSPQNVRFLYEASGRILKRRDEENRQLMQDVRGLLEREGRNGRH